LSELSLVSPIRGFHHTGMGSRWRSVTPAGSAEEESAKATRVRSGQRALPGRRAQPARKVRPGLPTPVLPQGDTITPQARCKTGDGVIGGGTQAQGVNVNKC